MIDCGLHGYLTIPFPVHHIDREGFNLKRSTVAAVVFTVACATLSMAVMQASACRTMAGQRPRPSDPSGPGGPPDARPDGPGGPPADPAVSRADPGALLAASARECSWRAGAGTRRFRQGRPAVAPGGGEGRREVHSRRRFGQERIDRRTAAGPSDEQEDGPASWLRARRR